MIVGGRGAKEMVPWRPVAGMVMIDPEKPPNPPPFDSADSLDMIELIMELEEEFDKETVKWALRYAQALASQDSLAQRPRHPSPSSSEGPDPLWDRELDG
jgi:hypothetical protein